MTKRRTNTLEHHYEVPGALRHDANMLVSDARALLDATAEIADEKVTAARERLMEALERGQAIGEDLKEKAVDAAHEADAVVRKHPYETAAVAFGVGALIGYLLTRRGS